MSSRSAHVAAEFAPAPDVLIKTMRSVERLTELLTNPPGAPPRKRINGHLVIDQRPAWELAILDAESAIRPLFRRMPLLLSDKAPDAALVSLAEFEFAKWIGWSLEIFIECVRAARIVLLWHKRHPGEALPAKLAAEVVAGAQTVRAEAENEQAEIERSFHVGQRQRHQARAAGKSRIPLTEEQVRQAVGEINALVADGLKLQTACKKLAPKYGVDDRTLKRYRQHAAGTNG